MKMELDQVRIRWTDYITDLYADADGKGRPTIRRQIAGQPIARKEARDAMKTKVKAVEMAKQQLEALGDFGLD